jgi:thiol-disulfide isomerase/thioredoxin
MRFAAAAMLLFLGFSLPATPVMSHDASSAPSDGSRKMAMCSVCRVNHGETKPEEVKATRTWNGTEYGFCSEKCAETFDADPAAFVLSELPYPAPALNAKSLDGKPVTLADHAGKVVLVDFWATWCAPCIKSMPELQKLHEKYAAQGVVVLGLSVDEDPKKVPKFLKSKKVTYPIAIDSGEPLAFQSWGVKAVPAAFLVDRNGKVVARWLGKTDPRAVEEEIQLLLKEGS